MLRLVLLLLLIAPGARAAGPEDRAAGFTMAFADWLDQAGAEAGILALRYNGRPVAVWSRGRVAEEVGDLASLSKAVTAVCIAALVDEGRLYYDNSAREVLGLPEAAPVTIAALLSHATGLHSDYTQGPMTFWKGNPTPRWAEITPRALDPARLSPGEAGYYYSNENYAVLGTVIEKVTGQSYETACRERVLVPAGIGGRASDAFAAYLPWGGWAMRMTDYARFVDYAFGPGGALTDRLEDLPGVAITGPVSYGMGMVQRDMGPGRGRNVWHFGALCFEGGPNFGTYAVHWETGWTVTAWYDICATEVDMGALDAAMAGVAYTK